MKVYLVQHGKAVEKSIDPERPLSDEGTQQTQAVADFIAGLNIEVECIWHSGKMRAHQTADILSKTITSDDGVIQNSQLNPNDDVTSWQDLLNTAEIDVMMVGHLPFMNKLASLLIASDESLDVVAFSNSGVVCLDRSNDDNWRLEWIVTPQVLSQKVPG